MDFATLLVSVLLNLQTPLFVVAIGSSIWLSFRMRGAASGTFPSNKVLAWVAFVSTLLICIMSAGEAVLMLRMGEMGRAVMPMLMTLLWGYFTRQSFRILNVLGR